MNKYQIKVDLRRRLVYLCSRSEKAAPFHSVCRPTKDGTVSKNWKTRHAVCDDFNNAMRSMEVTMSGFHSVHGINPSKEPYKRMLLGEFCQAAIEAAERQAA